jgi:hypothetical protein
MLIQFANSTTVSSEAIVSIKYVNAEWCIKLSNGYEVGLAEGEFEWLMTIDGNLLKINDELALSVKSIIMFEENEDGYLIGWVGEPPIEISQEKGVLFKEFLSSKQQHIVLADRIAYLEENDVPVKINTL